MPDHQLRGIRVARVSTIPFSTVTQLCPQLEAIKQAGGQLTVITSDDELGDELRQLDYCTFKPIYIAREISIFSDIVTLFKLWQLFRSQRFDIVHSITPKAGLLCAIASRLARTPIRLHTYTGQPWITMQGIKRNIVKFCDKLTAILNTQCYTDSFSQRDFLIKSKIISLDKIKVLGSGSLAGVDLSRFNQERFLLADKKEPRSQLGLREETLVFLFVGRVTEDKGIYELLEATGQLLASGCDMALLIIGPFEQAFEQEIKRFAAKHCGNNVKFMGFSKEPERFMAISDVLCIPSYREGFGTVVIEAAALGVPAIGTKIYGLTDAVIDGETGMLVEARDVSQLTEAMKNLATNKSLRRQLGENAKKRALSEFDSKKHGELLVKDYEALLK